MSIRSVVAMVPVTDMQRSIAFYERLGFHVDNTFVPPGETAPTWAWLDSAGGMLMLNRACEPMPSAEQRAIYYVYCADVAATHTELAAAGVAVGPLETRFYAPKGEFRVEDPDGYVLMFTHL